MKAIDDAATVGWFIWGTGTVGITKGETLRLSFVNLGSIKGYRIMRSLVEPSPAPRLARPEPGESNICDLRAADVPKELFDKTGRVQVRAFIKSSARAVSANLEVFDTRTGRTSIVLPLQELGG